MPDEYESAVGLEGILTILGWSRTKFFSKRDALLSCGAIFYRNEGRPPVRRIRAFRSELLTWIRLNASQGHDI
jgi:hypothetical protein